MGVGNVEKGKGEGGGGLVGEDHSKSGIDC